METRESASFPGARHNEVAAGAGQRGVSRSAAQTPSRLEIDNLAARHRARYVEHQRNLDAVPCIGTDLKPCLREGADCVAFEPKGKLCQCFSVGRGIGISRLQVQNFRSRIRQEVADWRCGSLPAKQTCDRPSPQPDGNNARHRSTLRAFDQGGRCGSVQAARATNSCPAQRSDPLLRWPI